MTDFCERPRTPFRAAGLGLAIIALAGCETLPEGLSFLQPAAETGNEVTSAARPAATKLIERDVEAPDVFEATEAGLWDGRPSLGGVWVAHPDVKEPERVIIRNTANGKFVIGALFRRERDIPGPRLQTSSDAAAALGMLAGAPVQLNVTALRRETIEEAPAAAIAPQQVDQIEEPGEISEQALDPIAAAGAALDNTPSATPVAASAASLSTLPETTLPETLDATPTPAAAAAPAPKPARSALSKPYIQIGIFSVEANANRTASQMRSEGMVPTVFEQSSNGKAFWRVVVGPAQTSSERSSLLKKIKEVGFSDAYAVSN
jgi:cell division septation protein DedD